MFTFDTNVAYNILSILVIFGTIFGAFFNLKSKIQVLETDFKNTKERLSKLEQKTAADYEKIEVKISELESKSEDRHKDLQNRIDKMPLEIISLLRGLEKK